ncbi:hypothetical protein EYZ11_003727 [Aspergillus tanneri]|uniref:Uncharacterized protein n=1 Tax=Aspergillus tanneri TaxID=1220188 RepID=A0A4S3JML4_9EURO|nr:uncharacterized protein ATNIH1004_001505 [Aspergillus tanneri]KAA8652600.1 hypothetical protein ATNIH1004_001505 [Aspergillus tanneri]THC96802.1 hypothetical protein EYZ11_003727 [Aspergillus tanneri]
METLDKAWHTAADALRNEIHAYQSSLKHWTDYGEEPLSGVQGKGTATDPYDAGNRDEQPGAPRSQQNTAVVPEALASISADDPKITGGSRPVNKPVGDYGPMGVQMDSNPIDKVVPQSRVPEQRDGLASQDQAGAGGSRKSDYINGQPAISGEVEEGQMSVNKGHNRKLSLGNKESYTGADMKKHQLMYEQRVSQSQPPLTNGQVSGLHGQRNEDGFAIKSIGLSTSGTPGTPGSPDTTSSAPAHPPTTSKASEEALKGPQCPSRAPYEFEKELDEKRKRRSKSGNRSTHKRDSGYGSGTGTGTGIGTTTTSSMTTETTARKSSPTADSPPTKNGSKTAIATMKEKLEKVVHFGHHSNK